MWFFLANCAVRAVMKISWTLLKYPTFVGGIFMGKKCKTIIVGSAQKSDWFKREKIAIFKFEVPYFRE